MATRDEVLSAVAERYKRGTHDEKRRILDEFTCLTGYHRKHAARLLRAGPRPARSGERPLRRVCDEATSEALVVLWGMPPVSLSITQATSREPRIRLPGTS